jgi:hypothetical protein
VKVFDDCSSEIDYVDIISGYLRRQ